MNKRGHPTDYRENFHPQDFIEQSKQGKSLAQIALSWDVHRDTIYEWRKVHPEFSDAVKKGREFAEAWYMNLGQAGILGQATEKPMNVGLFCWMTKNMFNWSDKVEHKSELKPFIIEKLDGSQVVMGVKEEEEKR